VAGQIEIGGLKAEPVGAHGIRDHVRISGWLHEHVASGLQTTFSFVLPSYVDDGGRVHREDDALASATDLPQSDYRWRPFVSLVLVDPDKSPSWAHSTMSTF
jgi:hypothetical protein